MPQNENKNTRRKKRKQCKDILCVCVFSSSHKPGMMLISLIGFLLILPVCSHTRTHIYTHCDPVRFILFESLLPTLSLQFCYSLCARAHASVCVCHAVLLFCRPSWLIKSVSIRTYLPLSLALSLALSLIRSLALFLYSTDVKCSFDVRLHVCDHATFFLILSEIEITLFMNDQHDKVFSGYSMTETLIWVLSPS